MTVMALESPAIHMFPSSVPAGRADHSPAEGKPPMELKMSVMPNQPDLAATTLNDELRDAVDHLERATHGIRLRRPRPQLVQAWEALLRDDVMAPSGLLRHLRPAA
jgi:hypothetical protein